MKLTLFKRLAMLTMALALCAPIMAQVTTGSITGLVNDAQGQTLVGATVKATHLPSGSIYYGMTQSNGRFLINGVRVGSDYAVEASFIGYGTETIAKVVVSLGDPVSLNFALKEESLALEQVVVYGERSSAFNKERTGASTNISNREMTRIPSLSRNMTDAAKLSPYMTGSNSFLGRESFATNITVDGANFNNNFGLSGGGMPGTSGEPISMDAIEEMQVVIAPYDVRQSNFTGAGINAVTKSGTNEVRGTIYGYYRNQDMAGKKIRDKEISNIPESKRQIYGFSVGAPIIKDKLFLFVNGELDNNLTPGNTLRARTPADGTTANIPNVSNTVMASDLQQFSNFLQQQFGYDTGRYEDWGGDNVYNNKLMARLDWNAHKNHKVTLRYNYSKSSNLNRPSTSNDAGGAINPSRHSQTGGMSFENSQYRGDGIMHSITGELHSRFTNQLSNHFLVAYTNYDQPRSTTSDIFPMVDIMRGDITATNSYMTAGYELFSYQNRVQNNTLVIANNLTYQLDQHVITAGLSLDYQYFANSYLRNGTGYYRYKDYNAFVNHVNGVGNGQPWNEDYHPLGFAYTYPINGYTDPKAELSFGQFAAYLQDEWSVLDNLKLTMGLRVDIPAYFSGAIDNPGIKDEIFCDCEAVDVGTWPKAKLLWSPRLGFNWDVNKNRSLTVRGGTGIFTGRIPFVWFTNQPTNSGMLQYQLSLWHGGATPNVANRAMLARIPFAADVRTLLQNTALNDIFPQENAVRGGRLAVIDKDFKLPQVWRTSLAADIKLPLDMMLTIEGIYTKDINAVTFENINIAEPDGTIIEGAYERDFYTSGRQYINTNVNADVVVMKNTNEGHGFSFSTQLKLPNWNGLSGDLAYTYSYAEEVTARSNGSDPFSAWSNRQTINSLNTSELALSLMNTPHRIMASVNYHIAYAKYFATTISLFYTGRTGNAYTYVYAGRPSNYPAGTWIAYLPQEKNDVVWASDADWEAYKWFAVNDKYVSKNLGKYAEKYGAYLPWNSRFDLRVAQDFKIKVGKTTNTLQFSVDIINFGNMLNSNWGIVDDLNGSFSAFPILNYIGRDAATGKAIVSMNTARANVYHTSATSAPSTQLATWALQFGLRYIFN
ncbi:MAG: TonB-dependent receptor [Bacteroidales bacterium]|nr:TonB-dependent receptor [Bacteroidales bacterium]MCL2133823.1 TonB-dependent receptor [Bacteroidales bacterium]